jgi:hypothetical protein
VDGSIAAYADLGTCARATAVGCRPAYSRNRPACVRAGRLHVGDKGSLILDTVCDRPAMSRIPRGPMRAGRLWSCDCTWKEEIILRKAKKKVAIRGRAKAMGQDGS